jgi:hypothetical protein
LFSKVPDVVIARALKKTTKKNQTALHNTTILRKEARVDLTPILGALTNWLLL